MQRARQPRAPPRPSGGAARRSSATRRGRARAAPRARASATRSRAPTRALAATRRAPGRASCARRCRRRARSPRRASAGCAPAAIASTRAARRARGAGAEPRAPQPAGGARARLRDRHARRRRDRPRRRDARGRRRGRRSRSRAARRGRDDHATPIRAAAVRPDAGPARRSGGDPAIRPRPDRDRRRRRRRGRATTSPGACAAIRGVAVATSAFCARWRSAWSISTIASIASAIGVARMPTQGSWRPCVLTIDRRARLVDRAAVEPDRRRRLDRDRDDDVLPGRDAAEDAAGVVGQEALRRHLVGVLGARLRDAGEAGADLDALDRVDAHHRVREVGVERP